ncbi:PaaI family thioesterase [Roseobacter sp. HKCCA0434]|uniref:PaaI family thioesterase n=1 Tax=Roseobacter sp. HKCCA0434 TaxID=3079297 RepID=UPI00290590E3|nr:PaaI family thioesterase [Roseobacter sp. HKCCA0434]
MSRPRNEPVQEVKARRDAALSRMTDAVPYMRFIGLRFDRRGNELTAILPFSQHLIGNPVLPALHGGAIGAFLESAAIVELMWSRVWARMEAGGAEADAIEAGEFGDWPKVVDITVDYLRSGLPRDAYARATITRVGRRYASVRVEAWQDDRAKPFAEAMVHFVMPRDPD